MMSERRLLIAVLANAVSDIDARPPRARVSDCLEAEAARADAAAWFASDRRKDYPRFTFLQVCEVLDLDPAAVRELVSTLAGRRRFLHRLYARPRSKVAA